MPKELKQKLKKQVRNKQWGRERKNAYVYGTLRKTGWKPQKVIAKGWENEYKR